MGLCFHTTSSIPKYTDPIAGFGRELPSCYPPLQFVERCQLHHRLVGAQVLTTNSRCRGSCSCRKSRAQPPVLANRSHISIIDHLRSRRLHQDRLLPLNLHHFTASTNHRHLATISEPSQCHPSPFAFRHTGQTCPPGPSLSPEAHFSLPSKSSIFLQADAPLNLHHLAAPAARPSSRSATRDLHLRAGICRFPTSSRITYRQRRARRCQRSRAQPHHRAGSSILARDGALEDKLKLPSPSSSAAGIHCLLISKSNLPTSNSSPIAGTTSPLTIITILLLDCCPLAAAGSCSLIAGRCRVEGRIVAAASTHRHQTFIGSRAPSAKIGSAATDTLTAALLRSPPRRPDLPPELAELPLTSAVASTNLLAVATPLSESRGLLRTPLCIAILSDRLLVVHL